MAPLGNSCSSGNGTLSCSGLQVRQQLQLGWHADKASGVDNSNVCWYNHSPGTWSDTATAQHERDHGAEMINQQLRNETNPNQKHISLYTQKSTWSQDNIASSCDLSSPGNESTTTPEAEVPSRACHAKWRSLSPSATSATLSATPATQSEDRCCQVPRLPGKVEVDVATCHACHASSGGVHGAKPNPSAPPALV